MVVSEKEAISERLCDYFSHHTYYRMKIKNPPFKPLPFSLLEVSATRSSPFRKKTVSFSSTTSGSYKTAREYDSDNRATDTDYFSPDEDDDEFFDLSPEDG